ncbi:hypothetical protein [Staphylococcus phage PT1-9]
MIKYTLEIDGRIILNELSYSIFIAECRRYLNKRNPNLFKMTQLKQLYWFDIFDILEQRYNAKIKFMEVK